MTNVRTGNDFLIGTNGQSIAPVMPMRITTRQQAYRTAAWLELMAAALPNEDPASSYDEVRDAISST